MAFKLQEMSKDDPQWPDLMRVICLSFEEPLQGMFRLFRPIFGSEEESFKEFSHRMQFEYGGGSECVWQKVVTEDGTLVGAALWKVYHDNPFAVEEDETVYWFPEGSKRKFAESALEIFDTPRRTMGQRKQVFLNIIGIHPSYQRRGIGTLIMDWGVKKADDLNYEMWLDASPYGKGLYEKHGFGTILHHNISPPVTEDVKDDKEWMALKQELGEMWEDVMWRPQKGWTEEMGKPWEK